MTDRRIPNSLQEKYLDERANYYRQVWAIEDAITALLSGNVSSYSLGNRSVTYQDIQKLKDLKEEYEGKIDELEALLSHRSARNVTTNSFLSPSCIPRNQRKL